MTIRRDKRMTVDKSTLSLAGEFAVASELCRRGIYAQLTLGLRKRTDLLIDAPAETKMLRIQVKTKKVKNWPFCKGIFGEDIILVFVDYQKKSGEERPDFYILTSQDWETMVKKELSDKISQGQVRLDEHNCPTFVGRKTSQGMDVFPEQISEYKERWEKIEDLCVFSIFWARSKNLQSHYRP